MTTDRICVKQPNGLFAEWSTTTDRFIAMNLTENDYVKFKGEEAQ